MSGKYYCRGCLPDFVESKNGGVVRVRSVGGEPDDCVDCGEPCFLEVVGVDSTFV